MVAAPHAGAASVLLTYACPPSDDISQRGIVEIDEATHRVVRFLEKPAPAQTQSRLASPCFYVLAPAHVALLRVFLAELAAEPLAARDAPGHFVRWLAAREAVYAVPISGRFDVGNLRQYDECDAYFSAVSAARPS